MGHRCVRMAGRKLGSKGALSLRLLQEPALSGAEGAGSDAADATFVRYAQDPLRMRSWYPPFAENVKDGAPTVLVMPARSKAWATRPFIHSRIIDLSLSLR